MLRGLEPGLSEHTPKAKREGNQGEVGRFWREGREPVLLIISSTTKRLLLARDSDPFPAFATGGSSSGHGHRCTTTVNIKYFLTTTIFEYKPSLYGLRQRSR